MRALIYLRVSTKEQAENGGEEGFSIPAQREACGRLAADNEWEIVGEYVDRGESARSSRRPQLQVMLDRITEQRDVDVVIVHKVDRFARNLEDHVSIQALLRRFNVRLVSVTENLEESPSGRLVEGIHALMAEFYSSNLASEVRKGMGQKAKMGGWPTRAPLGYRNIRESIGGHQISHIVLDPERAPLIRLAFELYATGDWTLDRLHKELLDRGLKGRTRNNSATALPFSALGRILGNKAYIGVVEWQGLEHAGQHEPLIDIETFERVQQVLRSRSMRSVRERKHNHYLKGTLWCGVCGRRLSCDLKKQRYLYFYCLGQKRASFTGCQERYVNADNLESELEALYRKIRIPQTMVDTLKSDMEREIANHNKRTVAERDAMEKRLADAEAERRKLLAAYYANAIDVDLLRSEQDRVNDEIRSAKSRLELVEADVAEWQEILNLALRFATHCDQAYRKAKDHERRSLNHSIFERVEVRNGKIAEVKFAEPFDALFNEQGSNKSYWVGVTGLEPVTSAV